jgi:hypothetical protein
VGPGWADYVFAGDHGENDGMFQRRWVRPVGTIAVLALAGFILVTALNGKAEEPKQVRIVGLVRVFPEPGTVALRQDSLGAELDFGYDGRLTIDARTIPDDQIDKIPGINRLSFTPGAGKEIESLDEGRHCASVTFWPAASGDSAAGPPREWCFTAA